jgi:hypothetical protein
MLRTRITSGIYVIRPLMVNNRHDAGTIEGSKWWQLDTVGYS